MEQGFNLLDYFVLFGYMAGLMILATVFIKEQKNTDDFFVASRSMPWWAVGMSILATLVSAISITGAPADFHKYGLRGFGVWWLATFIAAPVVIFVFIRFFVGLKLTSAYEYLEKRFSLPVRLGASVFFMLMRGLYIGVVLYASALIMVPATGGKLGVITLIILIGLFSAFYAVVGGIKAVIWTDVVQLVVVYTGIIYLCFKVVSGIDGGVSEIWDIAVKTGNDFSYLKSGSDYWNWDVFNPNAFWLLLIGLTFNALSQKGADQLTVQRYLAASSPRESAKALMVDIIGAVPIGTIMTMVGMGMFAYYHVHADRLPEGGIAPNDIFAYYITTELPHGLLGLFVAAISAAIISTVDSGMNCLATVTMSDFHLRFRNGPMTDSQSVFWARVWTIIWAVICMGFAIFIYFTGNDTITRVSSQVLGLFAGSLLGVFLLGMLTSRANTGGVVIGALVGAASAIWSNYFWVKTLPGGEVVHVSYAVPIIFGTLLTIGVGYAASFLFPRPASNKLSGLTFWDVTRDLREKKLEVQSDKSEPDTLAKEQT